MGQEFTINSTALENKINQLLPSQGGYGAGLDLSASTQIIPIVDLTESAEGSSLRADLQVALSSAGTSYTATSSTTVFNTTGFVRNFGTVYIERASGSSQSVVHNINDGTSDFPIYKVLIDATATGLAVTYSYDYICYLRAGDSLVVTPSANANCCGVAYQIADISGNLVNPTGFV